MSVTTDLNTTWTEKTQREDALTARAALENATNVLNECHNTIQALVDSGSFNTIQTDLNNDTDGLGALKALIDTIDGIVDAIKVQTDTLGGAGAISWIYTLTDADTGGAIDGASVWVTTDSAGTNIIASGTTDDAGQVTFYLDAAAAIYVWRSKAGWSFTNPDQESVIA